MEAILAHLIILVNCSPRLDSALSTEATNALTGEVLAGALNVPHFWHVSQGTQYWANDRNGNR